MFLLRNHIALTGYVPFKVLFKVFFRVILWVLLWVRSILFNTDLTHIAFISDTLPTKQH